MLFAFTAFAFYTQIVFAQSVIEIKTQIETNPELLIREATTFQPLTTAEKSTLRIRREPKYQSKSPIYGKIIVGNSPAKQNIVVIVDEADGQTPRIYIDANNNRNLTDDGIPELTKSESGGFFKEVVIKATFLINGKSQELNLPYTAFRYRNEERKQTRVIFQSKFVRSGELKIGDNAYKIVVQTYNEQGLFSNPQEVTIGIDTNRDGQISKSLLSAEIFWGGNGGGKPFNIAGESYRMARVSESGEKIILEVSSVKVEPKKSILTNAPAPDFSFQTLDNKTIGLSGLKGKVVLLDFWAIWCSPCVANLPDIKKIYNRHGRSEFEIIGISLDGGEASKTTLNDLQNFAAKEQMNWLIAFDNGGWDNTAAQIYNITGIPIHIVIDKKGIIRFIERGGSTEKINKIETLIAKLIKE
jgi:peroxiredoxin